MSAPKGYSLSQIGLHWIVAALIAAQYVFHEPMSLAWDKLQETGAVAFSPLVAAHAMGGMLVLVLTAWRLGLRFTRGVPDLPASQTGPTRLAAHAGHWALYALLIAMPVSGAAAWFGGIGAAAQAHGVLKVAMLALVAIHVAAAIWHQVWLKDGLMDRMKRPAN